MSPLDGRGALLAPLALLVGLGCGQERAPIGRPVCVGWKPTVGPALDAACVDCHGRRDPEGGVSLHRYEAALEVARAGDGSSPILAVLDADPTHRALDDIEPLLRAWITRCEVAYLESGIHSAGILNPSSGDFHGELLRESGYDFERCQACHGDDYGGGRADASCLSCHPQGPTDCATCHGASISSGAHPIHLEGGVLEAEVACATCHEVPQDPLAPRHFRLARGEIDPPPVEVVLSGPAAWGPPGVDGPGPSREPTYDLATGTCRETYCHGLAGSDPAAGGASPAWSSDAPLGCGSCHGAPPASHPASERCGDCHGAVSPGPGRVTALDLHLDGRVQLGPEAEGCGGCHGGMDGAPPPDLEGRSSPRFETVGAHAAHLSPRLRLSDPVACSECHLVPSTVLSPGHIDSGRPAEVFAPAGRLASADGADPRWRAEAATCSDVYCHGGGARAAADTSPSIVEAPSWTGGTPGQVYCGSCHGIPPSSAPHSPAMGFTDCAGCHPRSVDAFGNILFETGSTLHLNGTLETGGGG